MQTIINFLPILSFLFGGGALVAIIKLLLKLNNRIKANEKGTQALLRDRLYHIYYKYKDLGYRTSHSTENFENIVANCPVPIILAGGPKGSDIFDTARAAVKAGVKGLCFGRNLFQSEDKLERIKKLNKILREE